jgi:hypothetical protein
MIKMKKIKMKGMGSEEYPNGRIDSFTIGLPIESPHHSLIPLFLELGFSKEEVLDKLDIIFQEMDYIFIYGNSKIKAHLIGEGNQFLIKFDTSIPKKEIDKVMKKYFQFP